MDMLTRSTSLSNRKQLTADQQFIDSSMSIFGDSGMATLPRCRPSLTSARIGVSGQGTMRWGWRRTTKPSITPLITSYCEDKVYDEAKAVKDEVSQVIAKGPKIGWTGSLGRRFNRVERQSREKNVPKSRLSLLPMTFLLPRSKHHVKEVSENISGQHSPLTCSISEENEPIQVDGDNGDEVSEIQSVILIMCIHA